MGIFNKPEYMLSAALAGIEKYVSEFDKAAKAADAELATVSKDLEAAKVKAEKAIALATQKLADATDSAKARKEILSLTKERATSISETFRKTYGL